MDLIESLSLAGLSTKTSATLPGGYRHLRLIGAIRSVRAGQPSSTMAIRFNGDSAANYGRQLLYGTNATAAGFLSASVTDLVGMDTPAATAPTATAGIIDLTIPLFAGTNFNKSAVSLLGERTTTAATGFVVRMNASEWRNTAAITTITAVDTNGANFATGSFLDIYGIA